MTNKRILARFGFLIVLSISVRVMITYYVDNIIVRFGLENDSIAVIKLQGWL